MSQADCSVTDHHHGGLAGGKVQAQHNKERTQERLGVTSATILEATHATSNHSPSKSRLLLLRDPNSAKFNTGVLLGKTTLCCASCSSVGAAN